MRSLPPRAPRQLPAGTSPSGLPWWPLSPAAWWSLSGQQGARHQANRRREWPRRRARPGRPGWDGRRRRGRARRPPAGRSSREWRPPAGRSSREWRPPAGRSSREWRPPAGRSSRASQKPAQPAKVLLGRARTTASMTGSQARVWSLAPGSGSRPPPVSDANKLDSSSVVSMFTTNPPGPERPKNRRLSRQGNAAVAGRESDSATAVVEVARPAPARSERGAPEDRPIRAPRGPVLGPIRRWSLRYGVSTCELANFVEWSPTSLRGKLRSRPERSHRTPPEAPRACWRRGRSPTLGRTG